MCSATSRFKTSLFEHSMVKSFQELVQNVRNQNLLKLWLSFFCLSLANALASDSVGKIHAVHVNEVIRIKIIQSQRFSLWNICTGSLMDYLSHQSSPPCQGARKPCGCQNTMLGLSFTSAPVEHLLLPHFPEWLPWWECFPRRPWLSKVFEDNKLLKSCIPSPRAAHVSHGSWTRGTACSWHCCLLRMWHRQDSQVLLTPINATSSWGTCTHTSP